jgi:hypothetical protein
MIGLLPLLHATSGVATAPPLVLWLCCFAGGVAAGGFAAWCGARLRRARTRRRAGILVAGVLAAMALAPSVIPYDHILPGAAHENSSSVHAAHCHDSPAGCADASVTSGPGQMIDSAPLLGEPAMLSVLLLVLAPVLVGVSRRPALRPPLRAALASI